MTKLIVPLNESELRVLNDLAKAECRSPPDQARFILRYVLRQWILNDSSTYFLDYLPEIQMPNSQQGKIQP